MLVMAALKGQLQCVALAAKARINALEHARSRARGCSRGFIAAVVGDDSDAKSVLRPINLPEIPDGRGNSQRFVVGRYDDVEAQKPRRRRCRWQAAGHQCLYE